MKDEFGGVIVNEFVGLKSKMYSIKKIDGKELNTAKGVNVATEFNEFKDVLFNKKIIRHKMKWIQAKKHKIETYEIEKILLSSFDDKRFVLDDRTHTLAYFRKHSVAGCRGIEKDCDKENRDDWKILWQWKSIVVMEIYCGNEVVMIWQRRSWWLKNIVVMKMYCNNANVLW